MRYVRETLFAAIAAVLLLYACTADAAIDGDCNFTQGTTPLANGITGCNEEVQGSKTKERVRLATTANITLSGNQTIDGTSTVTGNRILVKNQSTTSQNGIYLASASAWTRTADANSWEELPGALIAVEIGTTNANSLWMVTADAGGTIDSTSVTLAAVTASGSAGSSEAYVTIGSTANLSAERALTEGSLIDITDGGANSTATILVDLTEATALTLGAGSFTTLTIDAGATDPVTTYSSPATSLLSGGGTSPIFGLDDQGSLRFLEEDAGGSNYIEFVAPAALTSNVQCVFENDGNPIPDSCVGDGTDAGAAGGDNVSINGSAITDPNFNGTTPAASAGNLNVTWQVSASNVSAQVAIFGKKTLYIPAGAMTSETTTGCADGTVETTTNLVMYKTKDCDGATQEGVQFSFGAPKSWDEGTFTMRADWTAASGSGNVLWLFSCLARSNDDAIDTAFGTEISVTDTVLTAGDVHQAPESAAITASGTPAENDNIFCRVQRDADNASDTLDGVDAKLIGVRVLYSVNAATDD